MKIDSPQPTQIVVRVIAKDGKFLGDDIGGALVTLRDVRTGELLASGNTSGDSGPNPAVMCEKRLRGQPILTPADHGTSSFTTTLALTDPRQIEFSALGPLAGQGSANRISATQWVYPGKPINQGDGLLLEIPGLLVQIVDPPTHYLPPMHHPQIPIRANVTMMCGCPIGGGKEACPASPPWQPNEFQVTAEIVNVQGGYRHQLPMKFHEPPGGPPSQFLAIWQVPPGAGTYSITVCAYQQRNGNTGVDQSTVIFQN